MAESGHFNGAKSKQNNDEEAGKDTEKVEVKRPRIIYPDNRYIRRWDGLMLCLIFIYAFTVPYQLGVSAGVHLLLSVSWFIVTVCMNTCFFIDTFLHFFRAYRDEKGRMMIDPKTIRRKYLRSLFIPNLLSNLPTTIIFFIYGRNLMESDRSDFNFFAEEQNSYIVLLKLSDMLKLLRLGRAKRLLSTSDFVREFRERHKAFTIRLWVFVFLIVVAAHWFACIWSFVAFVEAEGSFGGELILNDNWIGNWAKANPGPLNPIGWYQDLDRYVLSLFWAIQTITSIGYGNIVPFTVAEWWVGAILQLMAGILWAYIIGGLVGVVTAMEARNEEFRDRIDKANDLISLFEPEERKRKLCRSSSCRRGDDDTQLPGDNLIERKNVAKGIRRYIYTQNERPMSSFQYVSTLDDLFPVMNSLSPSLQRHASRLVVQKYMERVPYLSSRFLSRDDQSFVARRCLQLEFPCGEVFRMEDGVENYGRGILIQLQGIAIRSSPLAGTLPILCDGVVGDGHVLLEDDRPGIESKIHFLSYSSMVFIPRTAILTALARNPAAWKECGRWKLLGAAISAKATCALDEQDVKNVGVSII